MVPALVAAIKRLRQVTNPLKDWLRKAEAAKIKEEALRHEERTRKTKTKKRKEAPDPTSSDTPSVRKIIYEVALHLYFYRYFRKPKKPHISLLCSLNLFLVDLFFFSSTRLVDGGGLWYLWLEIGHACTFIYLPYGNE